MDLNIPIDELQKAIQKIDSSKVTCSHIYTVRDNDITNYQRCGIPLRMPPSWYKIVLTKSYSGQWTLSDHYHIADSQEVETIDPPY